MNMPDSRNDGRTFILALPNSLRTLSRFLLDLATSLLILPATAAEVRVRGVCVGGGGAPAGDGGDGGDAAVGTTTTRLHRQNITRGRQKAPPGLVRPRARRCCLSWGCRGPGKAWAFVHMAHAVN